MISSINEKLGPVYRPAYALPDSLSGKGSTLGSAGDKLFANYVLHQPGMSGMFNIVHKLNIPDLFKITFHREKTPELLNLQVQKVRWYPGYLEIDYSCHNIHITEKKFITRDDLAVCDFLITNTGSTKESICLTMNTGNPVYCHESFKNRNITSGFSIPIFTKYGKYRIHYFGNKPMPEGRICISLIGNKKEYVTVYAAVRSGEEGGKPVHYVPRFKDIFKAHMDSYEKWFQYFPDMTCSDSYIEKMYYYRIFLIKYNYSDPQTGLLKKPFFCEGRSNRGNPMHEVRHTPGRSDFWDFSKPIWLSVGLHCADARWGCLWEPLKGEVELLISEAVEEKRCYSGTDQLGRLVNQRKGCDYIFPGTIPTAVAADGVVTGSGGEINSLLIWGIKKIAETSDETQWLLKILPKVERIFFELMNTFDPDGDFLLTSFSHYSGMEYQPSHFYYNGYKLDEQNPAGGDEPLERVDTAVITALNAEALAWIYKKAGLIDQSNIVLEICDNIMRSVIIKMWDREKSFFFSLRDQTEEKVPVREAGAFLPFIFSNVNEKFGDAFNSLKEEKKFSAYIPLPTVERKNKAYAPDASWNGVKVKGPFGCMWNGPAWPFMTSLFLYSLGEYSRRNGHVYDALWQDLFLSYTKMMFRNGDVDIPEVVEHYNPETGKPLSQEEHYFHSIYIDLLMTQLFGIILDDQNIKADPIRYGPQRCLVRGLHIRGKKYTLEYIGGSRGELIIAGE
jgi:hypothetical protein